MFTRHQNTFPPASTNGCCWVDGYTSWSAIVCLHGRFMLRALIRTTNSLFYCSVLSHSHKQLNYSSLDKTHSGRETGSGKQTCMTDGRRCSPLLDSYSRHVLSPVLRAHLHPAWRIMKGHLPANYRRSHIIALIPNLSVLCVGEIVVIFLRGIMKRVLVLWLLQWCSLLCVLSVFTFP